MKGRRSYQILFACLLLLAISIGACKVRIKSVPEARIVPRPADIESTAGFHVLDKRSTISVDRELVRSAEFLAAQISEALSFQPGIDTAGQASIVLEIDEGIKGDEAYTLSVTPDRVHIAGSCERGLFYGTQTFLQLLPAERKAGKSTRIPCLELSDHPRFEWRGVHLDESRHFFGVRFVKSLLDQMARLKLNTFHWHLIDDQGFRIEIRKHPKLTDIGAWRLDNENGVWNYSVVKPEQGDPLYGGFYTQEEIKEIVAFAEERHITIVPEIEMPGHVTSMIWAYPELSCRGELWSIEEGAGFEFSDPLCAGNELSFSILEDILTEVVELFPSEYIHIGGDECKKGPWTECPKCRQRMAEEGLADVHELQSYFIKRIERFVSSKGRKIIGWDEILEGGLAPNAAVMSWRGYHGGIQAAQMGHEVVMTPTSHCYLDYYQGDPAHEPKAIGGYLPLSRVYGFDPLPPQLSREIQHLVLGAQANVWTEHIFDARHCEYMIFPRAIAMAEVLWTPKELQDYEDFLKRIVPRYDALLAMDVNFRLPGVEGLQHEAYFTGDTLVALGNPIPGDRASIRYTLDGSDPDQRSPLYKKPIRISEPALLKARVYYRGKASSISSSSFHKKQ